MFLKSATIGIEAPEPINSASLPHSSVSARLAAASGFMFQSSAIAGALEWSVNSHLQSAGTREVTYSRKALRIFSGFCPTTRRNETFAEASAGITVFEPSPV